MNLYTKPVDQIEFADIEEFCKARSPENLMLDYKEDFPKKDFEDTIAAFANTHGGIIILGVEEDGQTQPVVPPKGVALTSNIRDRIANICMDAVYPPLIDVEAQLCEMPQAPKRAVVLIRIHESDLGHWTHQRTRLYLRGPGHNKPYDDIQARDEKIEWFFERRQKSVALRERLIGEAAGRAHRFIQESNVKHDPRQYDVHFCQRTLWLAPKFPREPLAEPSQLLRCCEQVARESLNAAHHFVALAYPNLLPVRGGARWEPEDHTWYLEVSQYGSIFHQELIRKNEGSIEGPTPAADPYHDLCPNITIEAVHDFVRLANRFYRTLGHPGLVLFRVEIGPLTSRALTRPHLETRRAGLRQWKPLRCPDETWEYEDELAAAGLAERASVVAASAADSLFWAFGWSDKDTAEKLVAALTAHEA